MKIKILAFIFFWGAVLPVLLHAPPVFGDDFFGDKISAREQYAQGASLNLMQDSINDLKQLQQLLMYQEFSEGRCEGYFEVESAAKKGDGENQYILSDLYRKGFCVPQDDARALRWTRESAEGGYSGAYFDMGVFLQTWNRH